MAASSAWDPSAKQTYGRLNASNAKQLDSVQATTKGKRGQSPKPWKIWDGTHSKTEGRDRSYV